MKLLFAGLVLGLLALPLGAQDAATEERLNRLQAAIETLQASNVELQKRLTELTRELREVREQAGRPAGDFASTEDVKQLADRVREVDRKRADDRDLILKEIEKLGRTIASGGGATTRPRVNPDPPRTETRPASTEKGFEYTIQSGDTLSSIVTACREQHGLRVTVDQILKANPGLKPNALRVGQKIFIPAP
jgi:nucleoid-associated protein YgaU